MLNINRSLEVYSLSKNGQRGAALRWEWGGRLSGEGHLSESFSLPSSVSLSPQGPQQISLQPAEIKVFAKAYLLHYNRLVQGAPCVNLGCPKRRRFAAARLQPGLKPVTNATTAGYRPSIYYNKNIAIHRLLF